MQAQSNGSTVKCPNQPCRGFPDVAADADHTNQNTGVFICYPGGCSNHSQPSSDFGGTSLAAPTWAGILADINQYLQANSRQIAGFINPALYNLAAGFQPLPLLHDITALSQNGLADSYTPNPGWDPVTGLGSPDAAGLAQDLASCLCTNDEPKNVAAVSWGSGRLDAFALGRDSSLWHQRYFNGQWQGFEGLGGSWTSNPAAVSWGTNRLDVFVKSTNNYLYWNWSDGTLWHSFQLIGGPISSDPAAISWGPNRLDVFARGSDNALKHYWYDGSWHSESVGGNLASSTTPAAVTWGSGRLDVFVEGTDNAVWQDSWYGNVWHGFSSLGGSMANASAPSAVSRGSGQLDVFFRGSDDALYHKSYSSNTWGALESLGGILRSSPAAVSWGSNRLDVFVLGRENAENTPPGPALFHDWYDGTWHGFENLGGQWSSAPAATTAPPGVWGASGRLDVYARDLGLNHNGDYALWHNWNNGTWQGFEDLGGIIGN